MAERSIEDINCEDGQVRQDPQGFPYRDGVPGFQGRLNCKCEIWATNPMLLRRQQDQQYVFSPETHRHLTDDIRKKTNFVIEQPDSPIDGIYLREQIRNQHNFICARRKRESSDPNEKNTSRQNEFTSDVTPLKNLEFYGGIRGSTIDLSASGRPEDTIISFDGNTFQASSAKAQAAHHMWINDGSLFDSFVVLPSGEFDIASGRLAEPTTDVSFLPDFTEDADNSEQLLAFNDLRWQFASRWGYTIISSSPTENGGPNTATRSGPNFLAPSQLALQQGALLQRLREIFPNNPTNFWKNINPGVHWRVVKRTPLFQGEDFFVEIIPEADDFDLSELGDARFLMQDQFRYLDVATTPTSSTIPQEALVDVDDQGNIDEDSTITFDFTIQSYFAIQLGVGLDHPYNDGECHNLDVGHEYWIIICEKANPIFCHAGVVYEKKPITRQGEIESDATSTQESSPCNDDRDLSQPSLRTVGLSDEKKLRRLSTYRHASGKTLLSQDRLRLEVRQHFDRLVVTFSGFEDSPWVIERRDLEPKPDDETDCEPQTVLDFQTRSVPMVIPPAPIALMAGNMKSSFTFGPMTYESVKSSTLGQDYSILGPDLEDRPIEQDINLLFRDKGIKNLIEDSSDKTEDDSDDAEQADLDIEFTDDAEVFGEVINGQAKDLFAVEHQPGRVKRRGKAPCAQVRRAEARETEGEDNNTRRQSRIAVRNRGLRTAGSEAEWVFTMQIDFTMTPGDYIFPAIEGDLGEEQDEEGGNEGWLLRNCITPITKGFRLFVPSAGVLQTKRPIDVGHHVFHFEDSWSSKDMLTIDHSGTIRFLINSGMEFEDRENYAGVLAGLIDQAFYIQISVWWEDGIMPKPEVQDDENENDLGKLRRILFTGICHGGEIEEQNNQSIMTCEIQDYSAILQNQYFFNSPFFDKMRDFNAVYEILQLASFRDGASDPFEDEEEGGQRVFDSTAPASLLRRYRDKKDEELFFFTIHNGETILNREFALPGSYDIIQDPFLKFNDGENYWDALLQIGKLSGKVMFFDNLGVFHFDMLPYEQDLFNFQLSEGRNEDEAAIDYHNLSKADFVASPRNHFLNTGEQAPIHSQAFNAYTWRRHVDDVYNEIRVISTTPRGELLIAGDIDYDSLYNPNSTGFLGYPKILIQQDGIFGDKQTVRWNVKNLTRLYTPPSSLSFEVIGRNNMKPLDIITFNGLFTREPQVMIVSDIKNEIDPRQHTWVQKYDTFWLFESSNIAWNETNEVGLSPTGGISE